MHFLSFFNMLEPGVSSIAFLTKNYFVVVKFYNFAPRGTACINFKRNCIKSTHPIVISNRTYVTYFSSVCKKSPLLHKC